MWEVTAVEIIMAWLFIGMVFSAYMHRKYWSRDKRFDRTVKIAGWILATILWPLGIVEEFIDWKNGR